MMMGIRKHLLASLGAVGLALLLTAYAAPAAWAAPAAPLARTHQQSDGSTIAVYQAGDEFLHWMEDENGNLIALAPDGDYHLATWTDDGPVATNAMPESNRLRAKNAQTSSARQEIPEILRQKVAERRASHAQARPKLKSSAASSLMAPSAQTTKQIPVLVIYAFPNDVSAIPTVPNSYIESLIFDQSQSALSLSNYYYQQTYGKIRLVPAVTAHQVLTVNLGMPHAGVNSALTNCFAEANMEKALELAFQQIDPVNYDTNHDRLIENDELSVIILLHGYDYSFNQTQTPGVWAHSSLIDEKFPVTNAQNVSYDIQGYCMVGSTFYENAQNKYVTLGPIAHEFGHLAFDFEDLYDIATTITPLPFVDDWSLMCTGTWSRGSASERMGERPSGLDAYSLTRWGIIAPKTVNEAIGETLDSRNLNGTASPDDAIIKVPAGAANQYYLLQTRNSADLFDRSAFYIGELYGATKGYTGTVPNSEKTGKTSGVIVYHVAEMASHYGNDSSSMFPIVTVEEAHGGTQHLLTFNSSILRSNDLADLYGATFKDLDGNSSPSTKVHTTAGRNTGAAMARMLDIRMGSGGGYLVDINPVAPNFRDSDGTDKSIATDTTAVSAAVGSANVYDADVKLSKGTRPIQYSLDAASVSAGFSIDPDTGKISLNGGVSAGSHTLTVLADNKPSQPSNPNYPKATLTVTVSVGSGLAISTTSLPACTVGANYSQTIAATGGTAPYSFAVTSGALPAGLTLNTSTGAITGTPATSGNATFAITATDNAGATVTTSYTLTINAAPTSLSIATTALPACTVGQSYTQTIAITGGTAPYAYAITNGALPVGLTLHASTGAITGTPAAGTYTAPANAVTFEITVTDNAGATATTTYTIVVLVAPASLAIATPSLPIGTVGQSYSQTIGVTGGTSPYTFAVTFGTLPSGLTLNTNTGAITGSPTATGSYAFEITATDSASVIARKSYTVIVNAAPVPLSIATTSISGGTVGQAYSQTIAAMGGTMPYRYAVTSGSLPAGLSLNASSGLLSGTPLSAGTSNFTVTATDLAGHSAWKSYAISIGPASKALTITPATLPMGGAGSYYRQAMSATGGTPPYSFRISSGSLPLGLSLSSSGLLAGTPVNAGSHPITIAVTDANNATTIVSYLLQIVPNTYLPPTTPYNSAPTTYNYPSNNTSSKTTGNSSSTSTGSKTTTQTPKPSPSPSPSVSSTPKPQTFAATANGKAKATTTKTYKSYVNVTISGASKTLLNTLTIPAKSSKLAVRFDMGSASAEMPASAFAAQDVTMKLKQLKKADEPKALGAYPASKRLSEVWQIGFDSKAQPTLRLAISKGVAAKKILVVRYDGASKKLVGVGSSYWAVAKSDNGYIVRIQNAKAGSYCVIQK